MGRLVETTAVAKGHEISRIIDADEAKLPADELANLLAGSDAVIDFSSAEGVLRNVEACVSAKIPLVEGTTGWLSERETAEKLIIGGSSAMVFGANFSVGVNIFYKIVDHAAELFARFAEYETFIEEQHHSSKKDAPSGTALKLQEIVKRSFPHDFSIAATRAGSIPGTHRVGFDGPADQVVLEHTARSREGFAIGAVLAAEWIKGRTGFFEFTDVMDAVLGQK